MDYRDHLLDLESWCGFRPRRFLTMLRIGRFLAKVTRRNQDFSDELDSRGINNSDCIEALLTTLQESISIADEHRPSKMLWKSGVVVVGLLAWLLGPIYLKAVEGAASVDEVYKAAAALSLQVGALSFTFLLLCDIVDIRLGRLRELRRLLHNAHFRSVQREKQQAQRIPRG